MERRAEYTVGMPAVSTSQIWSMLRERGVRHAPGNWHEYERGKRVIESLNLSPEEYDQAVKIVAQWVGV